MPEFYTGLKLKPKPGPYQVFNISSNWTKMEVPNLRAKPNQRPKATFLLNYIHYWMLACYANAMDWSWVGQSSPLWPWVRRIRSDTLSFHNDWFLWSPPKCKCKHQCVKFHMHSWTFVCPITAQRWLWWDRAVRILGRRSLPLNSVYALSLCCWKSALVFVHFVGRLTLLCLANENLG